MDAYIISFLEKLKNSNSSFTPLDYENQRIDKNYRYLKNKLPQVTDYRIRSLSIFLQYLNLEDYEVPELGALSNLNWQSLESYVTQSNNKCILNKGDIFYDTKDGRLQVDYIEEDDFKSINLNVFNYFNSGDVNSLKEIIIYLIRGN